MIKIWIVGLLRAAWIAGTLPILIASLPFSKLTSFHGLLMGFAKRGKIMQASSSKFSVPQKFFSHFYVVAVIWTTLLAVTTWYYAYKTAPMLSDSLLYPRVASHLTGDSRSFSMSRFHSTPFRDRYKIWQSVFLLLLMELQVLRRLYEALYVFQYSNAARMHILGYLTGLFFYTAAPLSLCCNWALDTSNFAVNQVLKFIVRGKDGMRDVEFDWSGFVTPLLKLGWCEWIGALVFVWGWIHQYRCHAILGSLREQKEESDEYLIPYGDWFEIVSSPHYLAEIVIYAGILIASGCADLTIWLLFLFVVANLVFVAAETHRWYLRKFEDYPSKRRAVIPFVY
ncbi:3-oxo-5-alpha-steroid 4-dehydrogenase, C-terminal [Dillenia turbinata]|uniref:3-oxo-5-alpha-steroid 4-dehydrogenase, C-terminal n=1 Tax=Dillenia turbinata TaxID=194707 RepID=A0AAN8UJD1_9MAGN